MASPRDRGSGAPVGLPAGTLPKSGPWSALAAGCVGPAGAGAGLPVDCGARKRRRIAVATVMMSAGAEVSQHLVSLARGPLVAQRGDVDGRDDDPLARARRGLGQEAPIEVHHLAAAGPGVRGIALEARPLVRGHDVGHVLERAAAV